ncbi:11194_t:CDS:2 [Entrophospora sp. SA101]|nr:11194_t:CDS:2 [Entrophospora sp. SA101]
MSATLPDIPKGACWDFVANFSDDSVEELLNKLSHDNSWKRGTYVTDIIVPIIRATLKNLPVGKFGFVSTAEDQNTASKDQKGDTGKCPDIIFMPGLARGVNQIETSFGIIGIQVSDSDIHRHCQMREVEIPIWQTSGDDVSEYHYCNLFQALFPRLQRCAEKSSTVTSPRHLMED